MALPRELQSKIRAVALRVRLQRALDAGVASTLKPTTVNWVAMVPSGS